MQMHKVIDYLRILLKSVNASSLKPLFFFKKNNRYRTTKMNFYCTTKGKVPDYLQLHVIYEFSCPASNAGYNGKTDQNFDKRIKEDLGLDF